MFTEYFQFCYPTKLLSGYRAIDNVPFELRNLDSSRPLVLTDRFLSGSGLAKTVLEVLQDGGIETGVIFDDIPVDSDLKTVDHIAGLFRDNRCDSIIAIGGGSVIDTAKGVNIQVTRNVEDLQELAGADNLTGKLKPFIVIPTTAGTGSEATAVAVIADHEKKVKMEFLSEQVLPDVAVLDPRMTTTLPPGLTASTAFDALVHAIEALTCKGKNPISDVFAGGAIRLITKNLLPCLKDSEREEYRFALANASHMAGAAFSNSMVGLVHAIGHACGALARVAHGEAMAILLVPCMEYNLIRLPGLYDELLLHLTDPDVYVETPENERSKRAVATVKSLIANVNRFCAIPTTLRDAGVTHDMLIGIAENARYDPAILINPVEPAFEDIRSILEKAY